MLMSSLRASFVRQPFGDPVAIRESAAPLIAYLDLLRKQMRELKYDRDAALLALKNLCASAHEMTPDYATARQLAWAFKSIYDDVKPLAGSTVIDQELATLGAELQMSPNPPDPAAKDVAGQAISDSQLQFGVNLTSGYSPDRFKGHFRALADALRQQADKQP